MNVSRRSMPNICKKMKILTIAFLYLVSMMRFSLGRYKGIITIVFATFNSEFLHNMRCIAKTTRGCRFHTLFCTLQYMTALWQTNTIPVSCGSLINPVVSEHTSMRCLDYV
jgi:hypothetical protein